MKRTFVILLVGLLLVTGLAAKGAAETAAAGPAEVKVKDVQPTLRVLLGPASYDPNDTVEARDIEKVTGYTVKYSTLPSENTSQALVMSVASGSDYDIVLVSKQSDFSTLMGNNALLPLNEYIDAIAPELWDCVSPDAWAGVSDAEGNVYAFPFLYPQEKEVTSFVTVRNDLVKAAGINQMPRTIDEFYNMLVTLKKYYGDKYIILTGPYDRGTVGNTMSIPMGIAAGFGIYNDWMVDENGKVIYITEHKNFGTMIEFFNKLYREGLLDADYAINNWKDSDERISSGRAIMAMHSRETINGVYAALEKIGLGLNDLDYITPLEGPDGTSTYMSSNQFWSYSVIPAKSKDNAADVVKWLGLRAAEQEYLYLGEKGVHFEVGDDGFPNPINPAFTDDRNKAMAYGHIAYDKHYAWLWTARVKKSPIMWKEFTEVTIDTNNNRPEIFVPAYFVFNNKDEYAQNNGVLFNDLNDYILQLITGVKRLDNSLATFTADWRNNEGEVVRVALQDWYDKNFR